MKSLQTLVFKTEHKKSSIENIKNPSNMKYEHLKDQKFIIIYDRNKNSPVNIIFYELGKLQKCYLYSKYEMDFYGKFIACYISGLLLYFLKLM